MEEIKIIKNEEDYNVAVARVEQLLPLVDRTWLPIIRTNTIA